MNIYPEPKGSYCGADSMNNYVIDPKGYLYKCWSDIGILERSIGSIMDEQYKGNSKLCYEYLFLMLLKMKNARIANIFLSVWEDVQAAEYIIERIVFNKNMC